MTAGRADYRHRVLIIDQSQEEAARTEDWLRQVLGSLVTQNVTCPRQLSQALEESWDVIVTEQLLVGFDGTDVRQTLQERHVGCPLILRSGRAHERGAVGAGGGARHVVPKDDLSRLSAAVQRELRLASVHAEHQQVVEAYRSLVDHSLQGLLILQDHRVVFANRAAAARAGLSPEELQGMTREELLLLVHQEDAPALVEGLRALQRGQVEEMSGQLRLHLMDGSVGWFQLAASRIDFRGRPAIQAALIDVTASRRFQEVLHRGKLEWERTFDAVTELVLIVDYRGVVERLNRAVAHRFGAEPRELVGRRLDAVIGTDAAAALALHPVGAEGRCVEITSSRLGGTFQLSVTPRLLEGDQIGGAVVVGRDVTVQREAEEVVRRQLSIDQAEQIFATFRHEVGNALNTLKTTLGVLRRNLDRFDDHKREEYFQRCSESFGIAEQLLHTMRRYQTLDELRLAQLELGSFLCDRADLLFERARAEGVECVLQPCFESVVVYADPDALLRVLLNLVGNAVDACAGMPAQRIEVELRCGQGHAVVRVRDTGSGMSAEDITRAFLPFFTTKHNGTGMGLAIVQKLMVRMNGLARIRSEPDGGVTVELRLPLCTTGD